MATQRCGSRHSWSKEEDAGRRSSTTAESLRARTRAVMGPDKRFNETRFQGTDQAAKWSGGRAMLRVSYDRWEKSSREEIVVDLHRARDRKGGQVDVAQRQAAGYD